MALADALNIFEVHHQRTLELRAPDRTYWQRRGWLVCLLVLLAFVPRAVMAWKVDVICEDGPVYIESARHLENGDFVQAFRGTQLGLNLYPLVLSLMHRCGLDWLLAGRLWGTLMSTLVVLPLFGWSRRQFGDSIAALGCLLYAVHPALVERSPEVLRCPTYWLLLLSTLYFLWRAVTEVRLRWFLAAGLFLAMSVHVRMEAWLVLVPWGGWTLARLWALNQQRGRLLCGTLLGMLMVPLVIVMVNVTWLADHGQWEFCLADRFRVLSEIILPAPPDADSAAADAAYAGSAISAEPAVPPPAAAAPAPEPAPAPAPLPVFEEPKIAPLELVWTFVRKMVDAFDPVFGLFAVVGLAAAWRVFLSRDQQPVFWMNLLCLAAIAVFWVHVHELIGRYFFTIVLMTTSYAAIGLAATAQGFVRLARLLRLEWRPGLVAAGLMIFAGALGVGDAWTNQYGSRQQRRDLGLWVRSQFGPGQTIVGSETRAWILAYYAEGQYYGPTPSDIGGPIYRWMWESRQPAVVVMPHAEQDARTAAWRARFEADSTSQPFRQVAADDLPSGCHWQIVLVRASDSLARRPQ